MSTSTSTRQAPDQGKRTAREYLRVSQDRSGRARSIDEQQTDNRERWTDLVAFNGEAYADVSVSASRYSTKVRGGFERLCKDLESGKYDADLLVIWEASRASREVKQWTRFIDLCESANVDIAITTHGRIYDPSNGRDRRSLQEDAIDAEYESSKVSERVTRAMEGSAKRGRPHGRPPVGYRRIHDRESGEVQQVLDPAYAPLILELFERIANGESIRGIATDWDQRGITDPRGKPFTQQRLGQLARRHAYAAIRVHDRGRKGQDRPSTEADIMDGDWDPIVPRSLFAKVQRILEDPKRKTRRPGSARHLVSMIAQCSQCHGPITARYDKVTRAYHCRDGGHVRILADPVDALATEVTIAYLSAPATYEALTATATDPEATEALAADVEAIRAELDDLADQVGRGDISATLAARAEPAILQRLTEAETALAGALTPPALDGLLGPEADVRNMWQAASVAQRREVVRTLFTSSYVGTMTIHPSGVSGPVQPPAHERITFEK